MVRLILVFLWLLPSMIFAVEFSASVNKNPVNLDESFQLTLTLKDESAYGLPSLGLLKNTFKISSQQQSMSTVLMNGQITTSLIWRIDLTPQKEGETIIPSISLETSSGVLNTAPIKIQVVRGKPVDQESLNRNKITISPEFNKTKPYKNEPILFTIKIISLEDLTNVSIQKFHVDDAIVEHNESPKIVTKIINGMQANVIEFTYILTPLKSGSLKIPSISVQGSILERRKQEKGSTWADDFEPLFMKSARLKPFHVLSKEVSLDIQPPVEGIEPWLPARSLDIEEIWDPSQKLKAGEPLVRSFKIKAVGISSSQLPTLDNSQSNEDTVKIYADKPVVSEEVKQGVIYSERKEQYTLIPQTSGNITLPEISVTWWDVTKNQKSIVTIPARILQIAPTVETPKSSVIASTEKDLAATPGIQKEKSYLTQLLYVLIGGLGLSLLAAFFWILALQRKITHMAERTKPEKDLKNTVKKVNDSQNKPTVQPQPKKDKNEKLPDLNPT